MDHFTASSAHRRSGRDPPPKTSFQRELEAKMHDRRARGLAADISEASNEEMDSDDELMAHFNLTGKPKASPRNEERRSPWAPPNARKTPVSRGRTPTEEMTDSRGRRTSFDDTGRYSGGRPDSALDILADQRREGRSGGPDLLKTLKHPADNRDWSGQRGQQYRSHDGGGYSDEDEDDIVSRSHQSSGRRGDNKKDFDRSRSPGTSDWRRQLAGDSGEEDDERLRPRPRSRASKGSVDKESPRPQPRPRTAKERTRSTSGERPSSRGTPTSAVNKGKNRSGTPKDEIKEDKSPRERRKSLFDVMDTHPEPKAKGRGQKKLLESDSDEDMHSSFKPIPKNRQRSDESPDRGFKGRKSPGFGKNTQYNDRGDYDDRDRRSPSADRSKSWQSPAAKKSWQDRRNYDEMDQQTRDADRGRKSPGMRKSPFSQDRDYDETGRRTRDEDDIRGRKSPGMRKSPFSQDRDYDEMGRRTRDGDGIRGRKSPAMRKSPFSQDRDYDEVGRSKRDEDGVRGRKSPGMRRSSFSKDRRDSDDEDDRRKRDGERGRNRKSPFTVNWKDRDEDNDDGPYADRMRGRKSPGTRKSPLPDGRKGQDETKGRKSPFSDRLKSRGSPEVKPRGRRGSNLREGSDDEEPDDRYGYDKKREKSMDRNRNYDRHSPWGGDGKTRNGRKSPWEDDDDYHRRRKDDKGRRRDDEAEEYEYRTRGRHKSDVSPTNRRSRQVRGEEDPDDWSGSRGKRQLSRSTRRYDGDPDDDDDHRPRRRGRHDKYDGRSQSEEESDDDALDERTRGRRGHGEERDDRPRGKSKKKKDHFTAPDSSVCDDVEHDPTWRGSTSKETKELQKRQPQHQRKEKQMLDSAIDTIRDAQQSSEDTSKKMRYIDPDKSSAKKGGRSQSATQIRPKPTYKSPNLGDTSLDLSTFNSTVDIRETVYQQWATERNKSARQQKAEEIRRQKEEEEKKKKAEKEKFIEAKASYDSWLQAKKEKLAKEKRQKVMLEAKKKAKEEEEKMEKKKDAEMTFRRWKEDKDVHLKEKKLMEKKEENKKVQEKQEVEREKQKDAALAFKSWKSRKDEILIDKHHEKKQEETNKERMERKLKRQREREAMDSYEKWLEKKENQQMGTSRHHMEDEWEEPRPPWRPNTSTVPFGR